MLSSSKLSLKCKMILANVFQYDLSVWTYKPGPCFRTFTSTSGFLTVTTNCVTKLPRILWLKYAVLLPVSKVYVWLPLRSTTDVGKCSNMLEVCIEVDEAATSQLEISFFIGLFLLNNPQEAFTT